MKDSSCPTEIIKKAVWTAIFTVYAGIIFYASIYPVQKGPSLTTVPGTDKLIHAGEFILFTLIGYRTISYYTGSSEERNAGLISLSIFYGGLTELTQMFFPYRTASVLDWLANVSGVGLGLIVIVMIERWRAKKGRTSPGSN
ncbi:VanZ family protein [Candidatus Bipolaricaulota bacterium]|nr:VanZ family protein [Candidatus Bipolaricaulota bacterium]